MPSDPAAWTVVRELIDAGDLAKLVETVTALDEPARREVAAELPGHIAVARQRAHQPRADHAAARERALLATQKELLGRKERGEISQHEFEQSWSRIWIHHGPKPDHGLPDTNGWMEPMRVAGAGTISSAKAVVTWINRRDFDRWDAAGDPTAAFEPLIEVIAARPAAWQAELATRLALRLRPVRRRAPRNLNLPLALALFRRTGATPPEHDPLVVGWVSEEPRRDDPLREHLLPRIFEAEGVGRRLRDDRTWLSLLCDLAAKGEVSRDLLLDGCRRRFLRGGDGPDLRFFARLHEQLQPTPAELAPHAIDYARLLPTAPGPVAELSLRHLRALPALDPADVVEALEGLLFRAEAGLVRAGLSWLRESLRQAPGRADDLSPALAMAFGHESWSVQETAVRLAVRHARHFTEAGLETLREGTGTLPPDLHNRLVAAIGGEPVEQPEPVPDPEEAFVPQRLPAPRRPVPAVAPPGAARELAELCLDETPQAAERTLAAFVHLATRDPRALRTALAPVAETEDWRLLRDEWREHGTWMRVLAGDLVDPGRAYPTESAAFMYQLRRDRGLPATMHDEPDRLPATMHDEPDRLPVARRASPLHRFILHRYAEVRAAARSGTLPPLLLARPALSTGHVDPDELVAGLETLEAAGAEPLPADFQQALVRLPREIDPAVTARAARLTSDAGRRAARWLAGDGLPDPVVRITRSGADDGLGSRIWMVTTVEAAPTGLPLVDELLADQPRHVNYVCDGHLGDMMDRWPGVLPSHREVVAAHLIGHQLLPPQAQMPSSLLCDLAETAGPAGSALALLLAYRIFPRPYAENDTAPALRALRRLAAAGDLPAEHLGVVLAQRVLRDEITLRALVDRLDAEARHGMHHEVWRILTTAMPPLLPENTAHPTKAHLDLVVLAIRVARWSEARGELPALTAFAARRGTGRILRLARTLAADLG
ncbi:DUF6493 family protein [Nonomuraea cavernae]|uniref:Secreted protein n=1 Tax=Nonomuraea cavernae TaxID=2045107 RepID=A0A917YX51_9ACTN|nr:DUF6493 family protein [Nonomuraea cavernae]MCA2185953.1 DUF6493 family protein [Nonomuraea cavernae]GGO69129.1 hypothetical protein GCM10012289_29470 [Nonomuraea cavernae]